MHVLFAQRTLLIGYLKVKLRRLLELLGKKWYEKNKNIEMACSANQEQVYLLLDQSAGVSSFALEKKS